MSKRKLSGSADVFVKIGIIGTKEVGKTTLASLLNGHLKSLGLRSDSIYEVARLCPLPLNKHTTIDSAYWIFGSQIAAESLVQSSRQIAVCDRTVLDCYPFAITALLQGTDDRGPDSVQAIMSLKGLIKDYVNARPYSYLFYIPIYRDDSSIHPSSDPVFQSAVDKEFRIFLNELGISFYEIKTVKAYDRLQEVISLIQKEYDFD